MEQEMNLTAAIRRIKSEYPGMMQRQVRTDEGRVCLELELPPSGNDSGNAYQKLLADSYFGFCYWDSLVDADHDLYRVPKEDLIDDPTSEWFILVNLWDDVIPHEDFWNYQPQDEDYEEGEEEPLEDSLDSFEDRD